MELQVSRKGRKMPLKVRIGRRDGISQVGAGVQHCQLGEAAAAAAAVWRTVASRRHGGVDL